MTTAQDTTVIGEPGIVEIGDPQLFPGVKAELFLAYSDRYGTGRPLLMQAVDCTQAGLYGLGSLYGRRVHPCTLERKAEAQR